MSDGRKMKRRSPAARMRTLEESKLLLSALIAVYPDIFDKTNPKPLAIGVHTEIRRVFPEAKMSAIRKLLWCWCRRKAYKKAIESGATRRSLEQV